MQSRTPVKAFVESCRTGCFALLFSVLVPCPGEAAVLTKNTTWTGEVVLEEDLLIPEGITLHIRPGTTIRVASSESTKTDPEFLSPLTEITLRGTLRAEGTEAAPIRFLLSAGGGTWGGIIVDGGKAVIVQTVVQDAETAVHVLKGSARIAGCLLTGNEYGLVVHGNDSSVRMEASRVRENGYGVLLLGGASMEGQGNVINGNAKRDKYSAPASAAPFREQSHKTSASAGKKKRIYNNAVLTGATTWRGRILVRGIVRVPKNARLVLEPGTIVEFSRKDTDLDGIGENGLLIQGTIIAKGTRERPITFRSAERLRKMGDWNSLTIVKSSRRAGNLIEHCRIEDAYCGLQLHSSQVIVTDSVMRNNYRGMQFEESVAQIRKTGFFGNKNALHASDSEIVFTGNIVAGNYTGLNVFKKSITIRNSRILDNALEGIRINKGLPSVDDNLLDGNRHGMVVMNTQYGSFRKNIIAHNSESGMELMGTNAIEVSGNVIQGNGLNGIKMSDSGASVQGNLITENGEQGIAVKSFTGTIAGNNITANGVYNLSVEDAGDVTARVNWWGGLNAGRTVRDQDNDPSRGRAQLLPVLDDPAVFPWPQTIVQRRVNWIGSVAVTERITIERGAELVLLPGTNVLFSKGAGLVVKGRIAARGKKDGRISFSAAEGKGAGEWDEILLDRAGQSVFANCTFENAIWALDSQQTDLVVEDSIFSENFGGIRYTSAPVTVRRSLFINNDVGIRALKGSGLFTENVITENSTGIFVHEKGGGLTIRKNNIFDNREHNIRLGNVNKEDVIAPNNWWGDPVPPGIHDARIEPKIGLVRYQPAARKPYILNVPAAPINP